MGISWDIPLLTQVFSRFRRFILHFERRPDKGGGLPALETFLRQRSRLDFFLLGRKFLTLLRAFGSRFLEVKKTRKRTGEDGDKEGEDMELDEEMELNDVPTVQ